MTEELYHYGVKGMKWGVRRTPQQLGHKIKKLEGERSALTKEMNKNAKAAAGYRKLSNAHQLKKGRQQKKLYKATSKKAKYDTKYYKESFKKNPDAVKLAKYSVKSKKAGEKAAKARAKNKNNKWEIKAASLQSKADKAKLKIEKNEKTQRMYKTTIRGINSGTIKQGRLFMQYETAKRDRG